MTAAPRTCRTCRWWRATPQQRPTALAAMCQQFGEVLQVKAKCSRWRAMEQAMQGTNTEQA